MKFFIYARKSTEDEARQILSIDAQLDELRMLAGKERLDVAHEYLEAQTAKAPGRPVFNEMMQALEKGTAQAILAWHPDRLARNSIDGGIPCASTRGAIASAVGTNAQHDIARMEITALRPARRQISPAARRCASMSWSIRPRR